MAPSNELIVRSLVAAFVNGDGETCRAHLHDHAVHRVPGHNPMSGWYKGCDAIVAMCLKRDQALAGKHYRATFVSMSASNEHVAMLTTVDAESGGRQYTWNDTLVFFFEDGKVAACWMFVDDEEAFDAFWNS